MVFWKWSVCVFHCVQVAITCYYSKCTLYVCIAYHCGGHFVEVAIIIGLAVLYVVSARKWNFRHWSGYELAGNEIFLQHGSIGDWGGFSWSTVWIEWSAIKGMLITWESVLGLYPGFSLRILVVGERCNITGEYFERGSMSE